MTKIKNLIEPKFALGELGVELVFPQLIEYKSKMFSMFFFILGEYQDITS